MKDHAPIVLFAYNRPSHTKRVLEALVLNKESKDSPLYVFCDGSKNEEGDTSVSAVRALIQNFPWPTEKNVILSEENKGIEKSVIEGLNKVFSTHTKAIILEDDIVCSSGFLKYMNEALVCYKEDKEVAGITGYAFSNPETMPETYFLPIGSAWGWGTWADEWKAAEFDGEILRKRIEERGVERFNFGHYPYFDLLKTTEDGKPTPWDVCFYANYFLEEKFFLFPKNSLVENIGFDASGTHSHAPELLQVVHLAQSVDFQRIPVKLDDETVRRVEKHFESDFKPSVLGGLRTKFFDLLKGKK